tara:strand:+ start:3657 stop:4196 length:540 start_codon:yes stop_codon:yes gene_type:complete
MTDVNLVNLERTITKKDWISIVKWINVRWNTGWTDQDIKSLFDDYKLFPSDVIWYSLELYYKNNNEFFNSSKFFSLCHETWLKAEQTQDEQNKLPANVLSADKGGLIEYLELNGYESFKHAVWDVMRKRFKRGDIEKFEVEVAKTFDLNEEWESAKQTFTFPINKTLEQLKAKREIENG